MVPTGAKCRHSNEMNKKKSQSPSGTRRQSVAAVLDLRKRQLRLGQPHYGRAPPHRV